MPIPIQVAIVTFATFVWVDENNVLDAQKAFVSLSLFNIMRLPLNLLPMMLVAVIQVILALISWCAAVQFSVKSRQVIHSVPTSFQAGIGFKRINKYMNSPEVDESSVSRNPNDRKF